MNDDVKQAVLEQLGWHWEAQLRPGLEGLTDDEYFWEPAPGCWSVRDVDGRWQPEREKVDPPPPFTTIAWRMCHIGEVLGARASFHFGDRGWDERTVVWPRTAGDALAFVDEAWEAWRVGVLALPTDRLLTPSEGPPHTLDAEFPFWLVMLHVNREVIHHGAEVALLRDLWRATR